MPSESKAPARAHRPGRIPELEGLRAVLAWTVVASHVLIFCGWYGPATRSGSVLGEVSVAAVDLFMLLSGFAITRLLIVEQESFRLYIWRRTCRIVPAYWVALAAAVALNGVLIANLSHLPASPERDGSVLISHLAESRFWIDLPLHVTLLHGLAPSKLLPFAPFTFLGAAWSLSLEWQFYWIAPVALWLALRSRFGAAIIIGLSGVALAFAGYIMGAFSDAFLPAKSAFFVVGGLSYFAVCGSQSSRTAAAVLTLSTAILGLVWWKASGRGIEAVISAGGWLLVLTAVRFESLRPLRLVLNSTAMQYLGRVSYSTYLFHAPILTVVQAGIWQWIRPDHFWQLLIWTSLLGAAGTLIVSALSWRFIEVPFQRIGRAAGSTR